MIKPIVKQIAADYNDGTITGKVTMEYPLHWANDFVKVGIDYVEQSKKLTPSARNLFDNLMKNQMDFYNKLVNAATGEALTKEDIINTYGLTIRRVTALMLELRENDFIAKVDSKTNKCWLVNPIIVTKAKKTNYTLLDIFGNYFIHSLGMKVHDAYDLAKISIIQRQQEDNEEE